MSLLTLEAKLVRQESSTPWGFRMRGGDDFGFPLTVDRVTQGGLAEKYGLQKGDIILKISNKPCGTFKHKDAIDAITSSGNKLYLLIQRGGASGYHDKSSQSSGGSQANAGSMISQSNQMANRGSSRSVKTFNDVPSDSRRSVRAGSDDVPTESFRSMRVGSQDVPVDSGCNDVPVEGSYSTHASSDEVLIYECGPCKSDDKVRGAKYYCQSCKDYLCDDCRAYHRKFKELQNHKIFSVPLISKRSPTGHKVILDMKVVGSSKVNIQLPDDENTRNIGGCAFMPNGKLLLIDCFNKRVKLLDSSFNIEGSLFLSMSSDLWDISALDDSTAIVTMCSCNKLQFIHTTPCLREGRVIEVAGHCFSVMMLNNDLFACCYNPDTQTGDIHVLDIQGKEKRRIGVNKDGSGIFESPRRITASQLSNKIYVSDYGSSTVTCLLTDGTIVYQYKDENMRRMHGLYVDSEDNVLICSITGTIQVLTAKGVKHNDLLSRKDGVRNSQAIDFRPGDNTLVVGCWLETNLLIFKLERYF